MAVESDYQSLFYRLSDSFDGTVECERISDFGCRLVFRSEQVYEVTVEIIYVELPGRLMVQVLRVDDDDLPVLVSDVTSAVIAICIR